MKTKIRLAFLMHGIFYGGATRSLHLLLKTIDRERFEIFLFTKNSRSKEIEKDLRNLVDHYFIVKVNTISNNQVAFETQEKIIDILESNEKEFISILNKNEIDILHINSSVFAHLPKLIKANTFAKIVFHVRELIPDYHKGEIQKKLLDRICNYSDAIICISENEAQYFPTHKILHILPNPFDFSKITALKSILRMKYQLDKDEILIGMTSHFSRMKGHMLFLQAIKEVLKQKQIKIKFVIIGVKKYYRLIFILKKILLMDAYEYEIIDYIRKNKLSNYLLIIPYVSNIYDYINDLDIYVRPSLANDPWGRDIIEAMSLRKPVIATGTSQFYVENNFTGFLVHPNDHIDMAKKIIVLLNDSNKRQKMGAAGYEKIRKMCDLNDYGKKISEIYSTLVS